jgi:hypothetical protein
VSSQFGIVQDYTRCMCEFCGEFLGVNRLTPSRVQFHHSTVDRLVDFDTPFEFCPNNAKVFEMDATTYATKEIPYWAASPWPSRNFGTGAY